MYVYMYFACIYVYICRHVCMYVGIFVQIQPTSGSKLVANTLLQHCVAVNFATIFYIYTSCCCLLFLFFFVFSFKCLQGAAFNADSCQARRRHVRQHCATACNEPCHTNCIIDLQHATTNLCVAGNVKSLLHMLQSTTNKTYVCTCVLVEQPTTTTSTATTTKKLPK